MSQRRLAFLASICFAALPAHASPEPPASPPFEVLRSFDRPPVRPLGGLTEWQGALYGTSEGGGRHGRGAIFRRALPSAAPDAAVEEVYGITDTDFAGGLGTGLTTPLVASDGYLYGIAGRGGIYASGGWIYKISPSGERTVLHRLTSATDGQASEYFIYGQAPLVESGGWLYGTLYWGGPSGQGTVFRVRTSDGFFERLHAFSGPDGRNPSGGLAQRGDWLYGTTPMGGTHNAGTLFRIALDGSGFATLRHFQGASQGSFPLAELVLGPDGMLYGALQNQGPVTPWGCGSVFRFDPDAGAGNPGELTLLASFGCAQPVSGAYPQGGMVIAHSGDGSLALFGMTPGGSSPGSIIVYRISLGTTPVLDVLDTFPGYEICSSRLLRASDGLIYGQCYGTNGSNEGRVYRIDPVGGTVATAFRFSVDDAAGHTPYALVHGPGDAIYGTTRRGGPANRGSLFRLSRTGDFDVMHRFLDEVRHEEYEDDFSANPPQYAATFLTHASDGLLYGTRCDGGDNEAGSIFRLDPELGSLDTVYVSGSDTYYERTTCPHGPLVESAATPGTFFGTALGTGWTAGTGFRFESAANQLTPLWGPGEAGLYSFTYPIGRVALGPDDRVYTTFEQGWTQSSARFGGGVVEVLPGGGVVAMKGLQWANVSGPIAGLVHGPSGPSGSFSLYGSTTRGGHAGFYGALYKVSVAGPGSSSVALMHSFLGTDGAQPTAELTRGPDGLYYGSTANGGDHGFGTLFTLDGNEQVATIHHFDHAQGAHPQTQLVVGSDGNLYGTTHGGGPGGGGVIFRLNLAPSVAIDGPTEVGEGSSITLTASGADPQGGALAFEWDLDADGEFDAQGTGVVLTAPDGPSELVVAVRATDASGIAARASARVAVRNVAPTASFGNPTGLVAPGQAVVLQFSNPTDPSAADADPAAGFHYYYDCDGDGGFEIGPLAASSHACSYATSGAFTPRGRIVDKDGGYTDLPGLAVQVATPREGIDLLIQKVNGLVAGGVLSPGSAKHLLHELEQAAKHLDKGQPGPTINQLRNFIKRVEALVASGELPAAAGQELIAIAGQLIFALGG